MPTDHAGPAPSRDARRSSTAGSGRGRPPSVSRQAPALRDEVPALRRTAVEFATRHGASAAVADDIALAVSEACTNVVVHAYLGGAESGPMTVEACRVDGGIVVTVTDEGRGMVPRSDSPGLGMGLSIMAWVAQSVEIVDRGRPGACVRLRFPLRAARELDDAGGS